jgi:uncharacterized protein
MKDKLFKFKNDDISYIAPSWSKMGRLVFLLGKKILQKNSKYERLIALAKGGWTWSRTLADYLNLKKIGSIQVSLYTDIFETKPSPIITQSLPVSVASENLLLFDDVADSGETLKATKNYLKLCGAKSITTASLYYKTWAKIMPDFYAAKTKAWIIFPHEIRESINLIGKKWQKKGIKIKEVKKRFLKIGLPEDQVDYFLKKDFS